MSPKTKRHDNIFYTNSTSEFHELCTTYSIYGSFHAPQRSVVHTDNADTEEEELAPFVNLIHHHPTQTNIGRSDPWINNAVILHSSLQQITSLLQSNSQSYTNNDIFTNSEHGPMSEDEVTLFESSIASFMTSTASQIDTLRVSIDDMNNTASEELKTHLSGIISHLVSQLKQIMVEFRSMQLVRHREELELYHDPLKCCYREANEVDNLLDGDVDDLEPDERFLNMLEREEEEFQALYDHEDDDDELERILAEPLPSFPRQQEQQHQEEHWHQEEKEEEMPRAPPQPPAMPMQMKRNQPQPRTLKPTTINTHAIIEPSQIESEQNQAAILQQEQIFLTATVQNTKLDAAHKVESQMMQITSLLSQFSNLISEQQEEIQVIADSTVKSRENVDKGREKLVQATEQRKRSRHYFAWVICFLGFLLLFLNAVV